MRVSPQTKRAGSVPAFKQVASDRGRAGPPAISVRSVSKTFRIPRHRPSTLKERALHPFRVIPEATLEAARDVSFEVSAGETFGIVGRNGSGKSSLLKMLAGIYTPDSGEIEVRGRVSPFIELGVGFNTELTARDNVIVNGTLMGLRRSEIARRYPRIVEFAGLQEFEDLKLKNYSSGMLVRLAFSTAIQVDADVLLLDEVLAVGDAAFQEKCFEEFRRIKHEGRTLVLVTHAMDTVRRFCDRAMIIEKGEVLELGEPDAIAERYREIAGEDETAEVASFEPERFGDRSAEVVDCWVEDSAGTRTEVVEQGERIALCASFEFHEEMRQPTFGIQVKPPSGPDVIAINTIWADLETDDYAPGDHGELRIEIDNHLGVGTFSLCPGVANQDGTHLADLRFNAASFRVDGKRWTGAIADLPYEIAVRRQAS